MERAIELVMKELHDAEEKHPGWPDNRLRQVAIMVEEAGEALQAALNIIETEEKFVQEKWGCHPGQSAEENDTRARRILEQYENLERLERALEKEVAQTAAMALRWLIHRSPLYTQA